MLRFHHSQSRPIPIFPSSSGQILLMPHWCHCIDSNNLNYNKSNHCDHQNSIFHSMLFLPDSSPDLPPLHFLLQKPHTSHLQSAYYLLHWFRMSDAARSCKYAWKYSISQNKNQDPLCSPFQHKNPAYNPKSLSALHSQKNLRMCFSACLSLH